MLKKALWVMIPFLLIFLLGLALLLRPHFHVPIVHAVNNFTRQENTSQRSSHRHTVDYATVKMELDGTEHEVTVHDNTWKPLKPGDTVLVTRGLFGKIYEYKTDGCSEEDDILAPPSNAKEPVENPDADAPSNVQAPVGKRLLTRLSTDKSCRIRTEYPQNNEAPGKPLPRKRANPTRNRIHLPMRKREPINPTLETGSLTSQIVVTTHPNHGAQTNPLPMTQIPAPNDDPVFILRPSISRMDGFFSTPPNFSHKAHRKQW